MLYISIYLTFLIKIIIKIELSLAEDILTSYEEMKTYLRNSRKQFLEK